jgi:hypothetical protein
MKTMGTQMPAIKKKKKEKQDELDSPWLLAKVFQSFNKRDMFQGA